MKRRLGRGLGSLLGSGGLGALSGPASAGTEKPNDGEKAPDPGQVVPGAAGEPAAPAQGKARAAAAVPPPAAVVLDGVVVRDGAGGREAEEGNEPGLAGAGEVPGEAALEVPHRAIRANPYQPRDDFDEESIESLGQSLKSHGFLQPLCVRPFKGEAGTYELISGERRWRAAGRLGLENVPVTIRRDVDDADMLELALVENLQREDLNAMERARGFRAMQVDLGLTQEEVSQRVGLRRATVANHLRLLDLPRAAQDAVERGLITMGHGRALLGLKGEPAMLRLLGKAVREEMSVRALEEIVRRRNAAEEGPATGDGAVKARAEPWVEALEASLRERLGTKAVVRNRKGYRGTIQIDYHDREELDRLMEVLVPRKTI